jgi:prepilin-type N-terminal cleavage/methylation domain-containing protein/prepilin-type processing-associated H-X9-DG protein
MLQRRRSAFTLIELLVVIAIIAILIGLLLPAVQKVRAAAARTKCTNNLKQLALACHMYQDSYQSLPPGWVCFSSAVQPNPGWCWTAVILPYVEQNAVFTGLQAAPISADFTGHNAFTQNPSISTMLTTPLKLYVCPSDASGLTQNPYITVNGDATCAESNYVCNREVLGPDVNENPTYLAIQKILDGSSNTILLGERETVYTTGALQFLRGSTTASFEGRPGIGINKPQAIPLSTGEDGRLQFSSLHTGGAIFAFCDGSVHFVTNAIDADPGTTYSAYPASTNNYTLQNLIHPADGNVINWTNIN